MKTNNIFEKKLIIHSSERHYGLEKKTRNFAVYSLFFLVKKKIESNTKI